MKVILKRKKGMVGGGMLSRRWKTGKLRLWKSEGFLGEMDHWGSPRKWRTGGI